MIVLTVPLTEMRELLGHLRDDLKPETLVFAAVDVLQPALALAQEVLPAQARFAGRPPNPHRRRRALDRPCRPV